MFIKNGAGERNRRVIEHSVKQCIEATLHNPVLTYAKGATG